LPPPGTSRQLWLLLENCCIQNYGRTREQDARLQVDPTPLFLSASVPQSTYAERLAAMSGADRSDCTPWPERAFAV